MAPPSATATVGFVSKSSALFVFNDQNSNSEINLARLGIVPTAINLTLGTWNQARTGKIAIYPNVTFCSQATSGENRHRRWIGVNGNFLVYTLPALAGASRPGRL